MIKIEFQGELRKIRKVSTHSDLIKIIKEKFENLRQIDSQLLKLTYVDIDRDLISISSTEDLDEAYS